MEKELEQLGLTKNESSIYLYLIKKGSTTTGSIIKETKIANSRVYESLNKLIDKGLVTYNVQKDGKHFQAVEPEQLLELEEERKKKIEELIPDLKKLQASSEADTTTAIYEGFEGFKTAFKKIINDCPKGGTIYIIGFSEQAYGFESLRMFLRNINLRSIEKKQKLKLLIDSSAKQTFGKDRESEPYSEVRYMPPGFISPAAIDMFDDYVYIILWEEKPFVFMIKNKRIAEGFKHYHEFLWKMAKK
ncbi:helix-turn-helix domain-containing protein [Candidatus Woesearchaeota archaeon]|nr:helix-turn-helix domain-containing protein [Candidatus Woesearchaeota archaeon]